MKIVIAEKVSASAVEQLKEPGWVVLTADQLNGKLDAELESADALIVRSAVQADAALLSHAKKLRVIGRAGVGVDNIDLDAATRQGIAVMNTPGANAVAVAEQTIGHDAGDGSASLPRGRVDACWQVGEENRCKARSCAARRWALRAGTHWHGSGATGPGFRNGNRWA